MKSRARGETRWWTGLLVLFGLLLDITNLLRNLLQRIFVSAVLQLEVCPGGGRKSQKGRNLARGRGGVREPCCLFAGAT